MSHVLIDHELSASDPRRHPSSDLDDNQGKTEDLYDPYQDEENPDPDVEPDSDEDIEEDDEDAPSSNERRGYGHVPRQR